MKAINIFFRSVDWKSVGILYFWMSIIGWIIPVIKDENYFDYKSIVFALCVISVPSILVLIQIFIKILINQNRMKIRIKTLKKVLLLFVGNNEMRTDLSVPFKQEEKYIATDGHSMMIIPTSLGDLGYTENTVTDIKEVIPKDELPEPVIIELSDIEKYMIPDYIDEVREIGENKTCEDCRGQGEVEVTYNSVNNKSYDVDVECPVCKGSGLSEEKKRIPTGKKIGDPESKFLLFDVGFRYFELSRMIKAFRMLGFETISKTAGTKTGANIFQAGDIKIIVMPCIYDDYYIKGYKKIM